MFSDFPSTRCTSQEPTTATTSRQRTFQRLQRCMIRGEMTLMLLPLLLLLSQSLQRLQRLLKISLTLPSVHQALHSVLRARLDVLHHQLRPLGRLCTKNLRLMVASSPILLSLAGNSQLVQRVFRVLSMTTTCSVKISSHNALESTHHPLLRRLSPLTVETRPSATALHLILSLMLQSILLLSQLLRCLPHLVSATSCLPRPPPVTTNLTSLAVTMRTPSGAHSTP